MASSPGPDSAARSKEQTKLGTVLVVDDEVENLEMLRRVLSREFRVEIASSGTEGLRILAHTPVSVIIADMRMPQMNGADFLMEAMRCQPSARRVLLTAYADAAVITSAVNYGQIHYLLHKPFDTNVLRTTIQQLSRLHDLEKQNIELLGQLKDTNAKLLDREAWLSRTLDEREKALFAAVEELKQKNVSLEQRALQDGLTGLYNHRSFQERMREETARAKRMGASVSLILCDVDHFKRINDTYGHPGGDSVLKKVAGVLVGTDPGSPLARQSDVVARYGGEEFAIILPDTSKDGAAVRAERLRQAFANIKMAELPGWNDTVSMSFGIAAFPEDAHTVEELITFADSALLRAKQEGRDRVRIWTRQTEKQIPVVHNLREVQGTLGANLRKERVLCVISLVVPDLGRVEHNYGRALAQKTSELFKSSLLAVAHETLDPGTLLAAVSPMPDVLELYLVPPLSTQETGSRYFDQIADHLAARVELRLQTELGSHVGLMRVVGGHVRKLFARNVPIEYQLQEVSESGRKRAQGVLERRRAQDKLDIQKIILESKIQSVVQPIFGDHGRKEIAYEALARGPAGSRHESPLVLLDLAEDADLLPELDICLIEAAFKVGRFLPKDCLLFVNVLASTIADQTFVKVELPRLAREAGLTHPRVVLELSERQAADQMGQFKEALELVRQQGFVLCLDDVGTHHANLAQVAAYRPTWLKLDRSLVGGVDQDRVKSDLIQAIVEFGRKQSSRVVAEGIEHQSEFALLKELDVEFFQGYLFAKPRKPEELLSR